MLMSKNDQIYFKVLKNLQDFDLEEFVRGFLSLTRKVPCFYTFDNYDLAYFLTLKESLPFLRDFPDEHRKLLFKLSIDSYCILLLVSLKIAIFFTCSFRGYFVTKDPLNLEEPYSSLLYSIFSCL